MNLFVWQSTISVLTDKLGVIHLGLFYILQWKDYNDLTLKSVF